MSDEHGTSDNWGHEADEPAWDEESHRPPNSAQAHKLLESLGSSDDMEVLQALSTLAVELSMVQEDSISNYPLPHLVPLLVQCLSRDAIPDLMLYAINCIINLLDTLPNLARVFVTAGAIPAICSKLMSFEFIDLAEAAIKALEKLGYENGLVILQEGVLATLVELVYFFDVETQKRIMRVLTMLATSATTDEAYVQFVEPALPSLLPHLNSDESSVLTESALQFFTVLIDAVGESGEPHNKRTDSLCERGLLTRLIDLLQSRHDLTGRVFSVLERLATHSANVAESLLNFGIITYITQTLSYELKEIERIKEGLSLINALLPEPSSEDYEFRLEFYKANPQFVDSIAELVIPRVLSSFDRIDHRSVKNKSLKAFDSLLQLGSVETLTSLIDPVVLASFIQELLYSSDRVALKLSLSIVSTVYNKLPSQFVVNFVREGVVEKLKELSVPPVSEERPIKPNTLISLLVDSGVPEGSPLYEHMVTTMEEHSETRPKTPESIEKKRSRMITELKRTYTAPLTTRSVFEKHNIRKELISDKSTWERVRGQNDVFRQARHCLKLHERSSETTESTVLQHLSAICRRLEVEDAGALGDMKRLFDAVEGVTSYEIFQSQFASALYKWLSVGQAHAVELKESWAQADFVKLVKLLILSLKYTESFAIKIRETRGSQINSLAAIASNVAVTLRCHDSDSQDPELLEHQGRFANNRELQLSLQQFLTLDSVAEQLLAVSKPEDLESLKLEQATASLKRRISEKQRRNMRDIEGVDVTQVFKELGVSDAQEDLVRDIEAQQKQAAIEQMIRHNEELSALEQDEISRQVTEAERMSQPASNLQVEFAVGGKACSSWTYVYAVTAASRGEEQVVIDFKFRPKEFGYAAVYVDSEGSYRQTVADANEVGLSPTSEVYPVLRLVKLLHSFNRSLGLEIPEDAFYSAKLSSAIARQSEESVLMLTNTAPDWVDNVLRACPFLFPFQLRLSVLKKTNLTGFAVQQALSSYRGRTRVASIGKRKFTVKRTDLLAEALRIFSDPRTVRQNTLEFDYVGEEGTGLGPTLEFYYKLSQEIRKMKVWRDSGEELGLFPAPNSKDDLSVWESIGRIIGKAVADDRLLELPLSPTLWKLIFRKPISFSDLANVDRHLATHLTELLEVSKSASKSSEPQLVTYRGTPVSALHITFTVPGYDFLELKSEGAETFVTVENLAEYVDLAAMATLLQSPQAEALRAGINSVVDISKLEYLTPSELETLLCGSNDEDWAQPVLLDAIVPAHGYSKNSETILNLISLMEDLTPADRRLFLSFITGSPRLPIGGFKSLSPPLTVVRKDPTLPGGVPDQYMPSVMTCQNFLKLPDYSSAAWLRKNLLYAMTEGRETFHFS